MVGTLNCNDFIIDLRAFKHRVVRLLCLEVSDCNVIMDATFWLPERLNEEGYKITKPNTKFQYNYKGIEIIISCEDVINRNYTWTTEFTICLSK